MAKSQILDYYIFVNDPELARSINDQVTAGALTDPALDLITLPLGGYGIYLAPYAATGSVNTPGGTAGSTDGAANVFATLLGATPPLTVVETGEPIPTGVKGYLTSAWFTSMPGQQRTFTRSTGWWIFGSSTRFYWVGHVIFSGVVIPAPSGVETPVRENLKLGFATRHFHSGHEQHAGVSGFTGEVPSLNLARAARVASRTGDGFGLRVSNATANQIAQFTYATLDPPQATPRSVWIRFYIRPVRFGSGAALRFFTIYQASAASTGFSVGLTLTGQWALFDEVGAGIANLITTFGLGVIGEFTKFDCLCYSDDGGNAQTITVLVNGVQGATGSRTPGGVPGNRYWTDVRLGMASTVSDHILDIDDIMGAALPKTRDPAVLAWNVATAYVLNDCVRYTSKVYVALQASTGATPGGAGNAYWQLLADPLDFALGSHLVRVTPRAFGSAHASWPGDVRVAMQRLASAPQTVQVAVASAPYQVVLDMADLVDLVPNTQGWIAFTEMVASFRAGATSGVLGYQIGAAAEVMSAITENAGALQYRRRTVTIPTSTTTPLTGTALTLRFNKSASADNNTFASLNAVVECIGVFGAEDEDAQADAATQPLTFLPNATVHNLDYPLSPYARNELAFAPVMSLGGTYVGNNLGQDLAFALPPTFLMIRPVTGDTGGQRVFAGMIGSHSASAIGFSVVPIAAYKQNFAFVPGAPATDDQQQQYLVRIAGSNTQINASGVTYQYIAWFDPAKRFSQAHVASLDTNAGLPRTENLETPTFLPEFALIFQEAMGTTTTSFGFVKSAGNSADGITNMIGAAETANALTFGTGTLVFRAGLISGGGTDDNAILCLRRQDGNSTPDEPRALFFGTYTGDGAASRTINLAPVSGRRPMYLFVTANQGSMGYQRDPSHTANNSSTLGGGNSTTAITAGGLDSFTVGLTLNTNAVVFHYFGFYGCTTAGNGGWSQNCENTIATESPRPPVWTEPTPVPTPTTPVTPTPTGPCGTDCDTTTPILPALPPIDGLPTGLVCAEYTAFIVNIALSRIGISKVIDNLATDQTEYAIVARRHVREDFNAVLRDHPWRFATRYEALAWWMGTEAVPFNNDFVYAYLAPESMMLARRMAKAPPGRAFDAAPITFQTYMDYAVGPLILCNAQATTAEPLVLEYTIRPDCPAFFGDAIFRDAMAWRLAKSLAPALSRDAARAQYCETMYRDVLSRATTVNEKEQQQDKPGDADWISARQ